MGGNMSDTIEVDATGLFCPAPILKARQKLEAMSEGQKLILKATDTACAYAVPNFCAQSGHTLAAKRQIGKLQIFEIIRGAIEN